MKWSEHIIARALALQILNRRCLVVVPNCSWTGHECDILAVTQNLRVIDFEIKISRADFKADAKKDKWWSRRNNWPFTQASGGWALQGPPAPDLRRPWPPKVWKHYYCLPAEIWTDELYEAMPSPNSGVLTMFEASDGSLQIRVKKYAKADRKATQIPVEAAVDIARLASLRMWNFLTEYETLKGGHMAQTTQATAGAAA